MVECISWLSEVREVFPKLDKKIILAEYKPMTNKKLGFVRAKIEQKLDFNPEALLLGEKVKIKNKRSKPQKFDIFINSNLQKIKNIALRREIIQHILIHELLHIENEDLITISKNFNKRKKKKIHLNNFEEEVFIRFNQLRELKGIMKIEKKEHLELAISKILDSINWRDKKS
ncbi:MAG: hypothetical protein AABX29_06450 [Nanoarchaeota archaeon]